MLYLIFDECEQELVTIQEDLEDAKDYVEHMSNNDNDLVIYHVDKIYYPKIVTKYEWKMEESN